MHRVNAFVGILALATFSVIPAFGQLIYSNHFESGVGPEWSRTNTDVTPIGARRFLGQFGNDAVTLSLSNFPAHDLVTISFSLFVIRTWDGNSPESGPDIFDLRQSGSLTPILHTTFSAGYRSQAFPENFPNGDYAPRVGASEINSLGYLQAIYLAPYDAVYNLSFSFPHVAGNLGLQFSGMGLQELGDESWGIDNFTVSVSSSAENTALFVDETSGLNRILLLGFFAPLAPIAQEFVPSLGVVDFVDVSFVPPNTGMSELRIRADSPTGSVVAASSVFHLNSGQFGRTRVVFPNAVSLRPGGLYVLEIATVQSASAPLDFGTFAVTPVESYAPGRFFSGGIAATNEDLDFALGLFVPQILPTNAFIYSEQQRDLLPFAGATFTNSYLSNYDGATLTVSLGFAGSPADEFDVCIASFGVVNVLGQPVGTFVTHEVPKELIVTFNSNATAYAVQETIRNVLYRNDSDAPITGVRPGVLLFSNDAGSVQLDFTLQIQPVDDPPEPFIDVVNANLLGPEDIFIVIASRGRTTPVILDASKSVDPDSPILRYRWASPGLKLLNADGIRVTNEFKIGTHPIVLTAIGEVYFKHAGLHLEIITPETAVRRLLRTVRREAIPRQRARLIVPLQQAITAFHQHHPRTAHHFLEVFRNRAGSVSLPDPDVVQNWMAAANAIIGATSR